MSSLELRLSLAQYYALPNSAFDKTRFSARLRRPWYVLTFKTIADKTMWTLKYSEYCGKIHPFAEFKLYTAQDIYDTL